MGHSQTWKAEEEFPAKDRSEISAGIEQKTGRCGTSESKVEKHFKG